MVPTLSARKPANGPKPNSLTKKIARMISGKVRDDADHGRGDRHPQAFENAVLDRVPARYEIRGKECGQETLTADYALGDPVPVDLHGTEGN
jgi:hypothetical protein